MKKRNITLAELGGLIFALILAVGANVYFWTSYTSGQRREIKTLELDMKRLDGEEVSLRRDKESAHKKAEQYRREVQTRQDELKDYGDFLPSINTKPQVTKEILGMLEELGIKIWKIENSEIQRMEGAYTFNFSLKVEGEYKSFKLFLAKIYRSERIFRIKRFDIGSFDNPSHNMEVFIEFQTYFAAN
jgi:Tfp pilus assembly protein PilO